MSVPRTIRYEYTRPGKEVNVYPQTLVLDDPDLKVLLMEPYTARDLDLDGKPVLAKGGSIVWHIKPKSWYDVGLFYMPDGELTGYYTNLVTPYEADGDDWRATDLFLDVWTDLEGNHFWLDEEEFIEARDESLLSENLAIRATGERIRILSEMSVGEWPPPEMKQFSLEDARRIAKS